jgi:hypothetical protein
MILTWNFYHHWLTRSLLYICSGALGVWPQDYRHAKQVFYCFSSPTKSSWFHFFLSHCFTFTTMLNGETCFIAIENETQFSKLPISKELWVLGFELRAWYMLGRHSTTWPKAPVIYALVLLWKNLWFFSWRHPCNAIPLTRLPPWIWDNSYESPWRFTTEIGCHLLLPIHLSLPSTKVDYRHVPQHQAWN